MEEKNQKELTLLEWMWLHHFRSLPSGGAAPLAPSRGSASLPLRARRRAAFPLAASHLALICECGFLSNINILFDSYPGGAFHNVRAEKIKHPAHG